MAEFFDVGVFNTSFTTHSYVISNASRHVSLARRWSSIPRWLRFMDIPTDVEWMYIIRAWYKIMHTCVKRHTLHSIVDLVREHYPQQMGEKLNKPIQCGSGDPIAIHVITIDIKTLVLTSTSRPSQEYSKINLDIRWFGGAPRVTVVHLKPTKMFCNIRLPHGINACTNIMKKTSSNNKQIGRFLECVCIDWM